MAKPVTREELAEALRECSAALESIKAGALFAPQVDRAAALLLRLKQERMELNNA